MADVSRLRRKNLGTPPTPEDAATSLNAPEVAPAIPDAGHLSTNAESYVRRDGRSARKTNRTLAFATRVTEDFDRQIRDIADMEGLKLVEVLEEALQALKEKRGY
ncbi:hypothetical protein NG99_07000 [Erwinia typographi]|uniref:Stability/partitioning determinant n=1 Tax=Erwinia typographi TaxID=371042 RepID=A0A0A4AA85_9GAMM|nr:hypothetical protein [Erwinia typographi]KGT94738.1 hypothetical protein NG99_07000 [Erwinia typographi]